MRVHLVGGFLGAGKTTAIGRLARHLADRGERVAVVTNDQGRSLVDTELLQPVAAMVHEIGGGCFCCRYGELETALLAAADAGATVAIAEAVGSCTDLVATVVSPMVDRSGGRLRIEPLAVLVDPWRAREMERGAFAPDVAYLFRKQIEEADVVVLTRADLSPPDVVPFIRSIRPDAAVVLLSSVTGEGLADWLAARPDRPAPPLVLDYDRYAAAEATLGWLNARAHVHAGGAFDPARILRDLLQDLVDTPAAHVKVAVTEPASGSGAIVRRGGPPVLHLAELPSQARSMRMLVNARVALPPDKLEALVRRSLAQAAAPADVQWEEMACFAPARPAPAHRYAFRCGSGDDASCCAAFYERPDVRWLLGDTWHPGGERLTLSLAEGLRLAPGARVLDVACGGGASLRAIARTWPVSAVGLDAGASPSRADGVDFVRGDAHAIPFDDASFDAVLCECALSTFADAARALREMKRVLRADGKLAMSDMVVEGPIPEALRPYAHVGACLAGARTGAGWQRLVEEAGFAIVRVSDESSALAELVAGIKRKVVGAALAKASGVLPADVDIDVPRARQVVREAEETLRQGHVRYLALLAERPFEGGIA